MFDQTVAREEDAHRGAFQDCLLLVTQAPGGFLRASMLSAILADPDRALLGIVRIQNVCDQVAPEVGAIQTP
jgi:hypothetical protein